MNIQEAVRLLVGGDDTHAEQVERALLDAGIRARAVLRPEPDGPAYIVTAVATSPPAAVSSTAANCFPGYELTGKRSISRTDPHGRVYAALFVYQYEPVKVTA